MICSLLGAIVVIVLTHAPAFAGSVWGGWNLGEQDVGAAAGNTGNSTTKDVAGTNDLNMYNAPTYSADVPPGGSTLSMQLPETRPLTRPIKSAGLASGAPLTE